MKFVSCFSGIEAASVAWLPLGWECLAVAEIDSFPCAVLKHHYPDVPNLGDITAPDFIERVVSLKPDVLVGGPPCQDFSIAGLRAGLAGNRGNLSLRWVEIINAVRPVIAVTENVPGWLTVNDGKAFGSFLAGLVGADSSLIPPQKCGGQWTSAGMVAGPKGRAAWRILDAQYFGLPQRRKRLFVIFCSGNERCPAAVLFERESLQRDITPRREARESVAATLEASAGRSRGAGTSHAMLAPALTASGRGVARTGDSRGQDPLIAIAPTLDARSGRSGENSFATSGGLVPMAYDTRSGLSPKRSMQGETISPTLRGKESEPPMIAGTVSSKWAKGTGGPSGDECQNLIAHTLRAEYDASEDGSGRGTPLVPVAIQERAMCENPDAEPDGIGIRTDGQAYTLEARETAQAVAFHPTQDPITSDDGTTHSLGCGNRNGGATVAVAIPINTQLGLRGAETSNTAREGVGIGEDGDPAFTLQMQHHHAVAFESRFARNGRGAPEPVVPPLKAQSGETGKGDAAPLLLHRMQVRRLTPRECERLQGFPDDFTLVPYRSKPASDGPRYKALGNSMAVPVMLWLGQRIQMIEGL